MKKTLTSIGNATLLFKDSVPILVTDPWFGDEDPAYFGSWILSHEIPKSIKQDINSSKFVWYSHGHPDHMNPKSTKRFKSHKILLPDHYGARIYKDLKSYGFDISILPDRKWINLTKNIKIQSITTFLQDAVLLVDFCGKLFINLNDSGAKGCARYISNIAKEYKHSFVFALSGYGDADMINIFNEDGSFIEPYAAKKSPVGAQLSFIAKKVGANGVIPSSSFHQYQRTDSIWAQAFTTPHDVYTDGLVDSLNFIPPFCEVDCESLEYSELNPKKILASGKSPEEFGDNYSDELDTVDLKKINDYFSKKDFVKNYYGFLNFRVGGKDNIIRMNRFSKRGITFNVPRGSLMTSIEYRIFDDLLIGNFMKTTLHNTTSLYEGPLNQNFTNNIAKFADNGNAHSKDQVRKYLREYQNRAGYEFFLDSFGDYSKSFFSRLLINNPKSFEVLKKIYRSLR